MLEDSECSSRKKFKPLPSSHEHESERRIRRHERRDKKCGRRLRFEDFYENENEEKGYYRTSFTPLEMLPYVRIVFLMVLVFVLFVYYLINHSRS